MKRESRGKPALMALRGRRNQKKLGDGGTSVGSQRGETKQDEWGDELNEPNRKEKNQVGFKVHLWLYALFWGFPWRRNGVWNDNLLLGSVGGGGGGGEKGRWVDKGNAGRDRSVRWGKGQEG